MGSITGIVLAHTHQLDNEIPAAADALVFLEHAWHDRLGLYPLSIMFSLPWASFLWALAAFVVRIFASMLILPDISMKIITFSLPSILCALTYANLVCLKYTPNPISVAQSWGQGAVGYLAASIGRDNRVHIENDGPSH